MKNLCLYTALALALGTMFYACGDGGDVPSGNVALYASYDSADLAAFAQETGFSNATLFNTTVALVHTGSGTACPVLEWEDITIANTSALLAPVVEELLEMNPCPPRSYNRLRISFNQDIAFTIGGITNTCTFIPEDEGFMGKRDRIPNRAFCDDMTATCTLDVNGAVNVLANHTAKLLLHFDVKELLLRDFDTGFCSVSKLKVTPLHAAGGEND